MIVHFDERGLMELLQFRYFMTAAKYENMTKAAEELHIAQPALSQSIKRLETELGVELFDRSRHRIALNEHGRLLEKSCAPFSTPSTACRPSFRSPSTPPTIWCA